VVDVAPVRLLRHVDDLSRRLSTTMPHNAHWSDNRQHVVSPNPPTAPLSRSTHRLRVTIRHGRRVHRLRCIERSCLAVASAQWWYEGTVSR